MSAPWIVLQVLRIRADPGRSSGGGSFWGAEPERDATPAPVFHLRHEPVSAGPRSPADAAGPRWDGGALLAFATRSDLSAWFAPRRASIDPRGAGATRAVVTNVCEEWVVRESETRRGDPVVLVRHHWRHPALSRATFRETWRGSHAELVGELGEATARIHRYAQLHNVSAPNDALYDAAGDAVDGTSLWSFAGLEELETFLGGSDYREIAADERDFCSSTEFYTARNRVVCDTSTVQHS